MGIKYMTLFLAFLINAFVLAEPLEIEEALNLQYNQKNVIKINFIMNKGYYLYKEKFKFVVDARDNKV